MNSPTTREREAARKPIENIHRNSFLGWWDSIRKLFGYMSDEEYETKRKQAERVRIFAARNIQGYTGSEKNRRQIRKSYNRLGLPNNKGKF